MNVTMTLAGIAGFILSIGMAVDANVLIFERVKEEFRNNRTMSEALSEGFKRAWNSIRDSNISSLITCAILIWFGTSTRARLRHHARHRHPAFDVHRHHRHQEFPARDHRKPH